MECPTCGTKMIKCGSYANKWGMMQSWRCRACGKTKCMPVDGSRSSKVLLDLIEKRTRELRREWKGATRKVIDLNGKVREVNFDELQEIIDEAIKKVVKINGR